MKRTKTFQIILGLVLFLAVPLLIIKYIYPNLQLDIPKFVEEYLKLMVGALLSVFLLPINKIINLNFEKRLAINKIIFLLKDYRSMLKNTMEKIETIDNKQEKHSFFCIIRDNPLKEIEDKITDEKHDFYSKQYSQKDISPFPNLDFLQQILLNKQNNIESQLMMYKQILNELNKLL